METVKDLIMLILILFITAFGVFATNKAMNRVEIAECEKWQVYAEEYEQFYLLKWQDSQCKAHGIFINTKVID